MSSSPPAPPRRLRRCLRPTGRWDARRCACARLYVAASDHPCLLSGGRFAEDRVEILPVDGDGVIDLAALGAALDGHDRLEGLPLVAVHAANNETGVIQPVAEIAALVKAAGGILVIDAVQAAGRIPVDISEGYGDYSDLVVAQDRRPEGRRRHRRAGPT